jgi:hypothetical protein
VSAFHTDVAAGPNDPTKQISSDAWNKKHKGEIVDTDSATEIAHGIRGADLHSDSHAKAHDHTAADGSDALTNDEHDGFSEYAEIAAPSTPAANKLRLFAKEKDGVAELYYKTDTGRERDLSGYTLDFRAYAGPGDLRVGTANITSGQVRLTASGFLSTDVGKSVVVNGAGVAGADLTTTVSAFVSATQVDLALAASTTVVGAIYGIGTDFTAQVQTALTWLNAATPPSGGLGGGTLILPSRGVFHRGYLCMGQIDMTGMRQIKIQGLTSNSAGTKPLAYFDLIYGGSLTATHGAGSFIRMESAGGCSLRDLMVGYISNSFTGTLVYCGGGPGGNGAQNVIDNCTLQGHGATVTSCSALLSFNQSNGHTVRNTIFKFAQYGIYGRATSFSNAINVEVCTFHQLVKHAIKNANEAWNIIACTFQERLDGHPGAYTEDIQAHGTVSFINCWFGDAGGNESDLGGEWIRFRGVSLNVIGGMMGPTYPVTPPGVLAGAAGAAGLPNGTYKYKVAYVTENGESVGGTTSADVTVVNQQISLTNVPVSPNSLVTQRKIYRTAAGGADGTQKLALTIADNTTTTATDNVADGSLGAAYLTVDETSAMIVLGDAGASGSVTLLGPNFVGGRVIQTVRGSALIDHVVVIGPRETGTLLHDPTSVIIAKFFIGNSSPTVNDMISTGSIPFPINNVQIGNIAALPANDILNHYMGNMRATAGSEDNAFGFITRTGGGTNQPFEFWTGNGTPVRAFKIKKGGNVSYQPMELVDYLRLDEIAAPSAPAADTARLYARDKGGLTEVFYKNSAGTERDLSLGGAAATPSIARTLALMGS